MRSSSLTVLLRGLATLLLTTTVTLVAFLGILEAYVRLATPRPRINIVRNDGLRRLVEVEGTWTWTESPRGAEAYARCLEAHGEAVPRVLVVGSSIAYGTDVGPEAPFTVRLMERAAARGEPWCLLNVAQPAMVGEQKLALARAHLGESGARVLLWEVWGEVGHFARVGDRAYLPTVGMHVDADGVPAIPWLPLAPGLHHGLLRWSRGWEYLSLRASAPRVVTLDARSPAEGIALAQAMAEVARAHDAVLLPVIATPLPASGTKILWKRQEPVHLAIASWLTGQGIAWVDLGGTLEGEDILPLRADPCCHFSEAGHARVAEVLEVPLREALAAGEP